MLLQSVTKDFKGLQFSIFDIINILKPVKQLVKLLYFNPQPVLCDRHLQFFQKGPSSVYFRSFSSKHQNNFTTNQCEIMSVQYTGLGFEPATFRTSLLQLPLDQGSRPFICSFFNFIIQIAHIWSVVNGIIYDPYLMVSCKERIGFFKITNPIK